MTQRVRRRLLACAFACAVLSLVAAPAVAAGDSWTFCVASARGDNVWITDVFAARGAARVDVQCPEPVTDKTAAVNAQFAAIEFNRKLGAKLHEAPARELGGER